MISLAIGVLIFMLNREFFVGYQNGASSSNGYMYTLVFSNLVLGFVFLLPIAASNSPSLTDDSLKNFVGFASKKDPINFATFSTFLGEQALGSFLATVVIVTGKGVYEDYGEVIAAIYSFTLYVSTILIMSISAIRFLSFFVHRSVFLYLFASGSTVFILFSFYQLGLRLAQ